MTKIDKTDIQNINLIIKETNLKGVSKVFTRAAYNAQWAKITGHSPV